MAPTHGQVAHRMVTALLACMQQTHPELVKGVQTILRSTAEEDPTDEVARISAGAVDRIIDPQTR